MITKKTVRRLQDAWIGEVMMVKLTDGNFYVGCLRKITTTRITLSGARSTQLPKLAHDKIDIMWSEIDEVYRIDNGLMI